MCSMTATVPVQLGAEPLLPPSPSSSPLMKGAQRLGGDDDKAVGARGVPNLQPEPESEPLVVRYAPPSAVTFTLNQHRTTQVFTTSSSSTVFTWDVDLEDYRPSSRIDAQHTVRVGAAADEYRFAQELDAYLRAGRYAAHVDPVG